VLTLEQLFYVCIKKKVYQFFALTSHAFFALTQPNLLYPFKNHFDREAMKIIVLAIPLNLYSHSLTQLSSLPIVELRIFDRADRNSNSPLI
jgi:hypothetical protein